jgi:hypothetical protein
VLVLACLTCGCGRSSDAENHAVTFGFNEDPVGAWFDAQAELGMPARRFPVAWSEVEPAQGRWQWDRADARYAAMLRAGLEPVLVAIGAPCWARAQPSGCARGSGGVPALGFDRDWAEYAGRLARRYPRAIGVEIWNEPNVAQLFPPYPDPKRYAELLRAAYSAVKLTNPRMPVISGGLLALATTDARGMSDAEFLAGMFAAGGGAALDAIGAHPYPPATALAGGAAASGAVESELDALRSVRNAAGQSDTDFWITEVGVSTTSIPGPVKEAESVQADDLVAIADALMTDDDVAVVLIHRLIDRVPTSGDAAGLAEAGFGVLRSDGTPKPAACAMSRALGGQLTC